MARSIGGAAVMPELPEVETTRRGVQPLLNGRRVRAVRVHDGRLRRPVPRNLAACLRGSASMMYPAGQSICCFILAAALCLSISGCPAACAWLKLNRRA